MLSQPDKEGIHGPHNRSVREEQRLPFTDLLQSRGVVFLTQASAPDIMRALLRHLGQFDQTVTLEFATEEEDGPGT